MKLKSEIDGAIILLTRNQESAAKTTTTKKHAHQLQASAAKLLRSGNIKMPNRSFGQNLQVEEES